MKLKGRKKLLADAAGLGLTNILLEVVGLAFQLYLSGVLGTDGLGLFELISSVYILATTFATSGISMSVTRVVAEAMGRKEEASTINDIMKKAFLLSLALGLSAAVMLFSLSDLFAGILIQNVRTSDCFKILAVGLPFMSIGSCLNGFFIAERRAVKAASSYIIEDFIKIAIVFMIFSLFPPQDALIGCTELTAGLIAGEALACVISHLMYLADWRRLKPGAQKADHVVKKILRIGVPVATSSYLRSGLTTLENLLIPIGLQKAGYSVEGALSLFGSLKGLIIPVIFFPAAFLQAFTRVLVPEITESYAKADMDGIRRTGATVLRGTLLFSVLVGVVFGVFHEGLGQLLFHSSEQGKMLLLLAPLAPMMYLDGVVDGILKGMDEQVAVMRYNLYEAAIRVILVYFILPHTGFVGFIITIYAGNTINAALSLQRLIRKAGVRIGVFRFFVVPAAAAGVCCCSFFLLFCRVFSCSGSVCTVIAIAASCLCYGLILKVLMGSGSVSYKKMPMR